MFKSCGKTLAIGLAVLLSLGAAAVVALAEDAPAPPETTIPGTPVEIPETPVTPEIPPEVVPAPDPIATVTAYLEATGTDAETVTRITTALSEALASGEVDPAQIQELVDAMIRTQARAEIVLRVAERVRLMATDDLPFGQVMKAFRLSLKEGKNRGIDNALAQAEKFVRKTQERNSVSAGPAGSDGQNSKGAGPSEGKGGGKDGEKGGGKEKGGK